jgi:hypothetical protein
MTMEILGLVLDLFVVALLVPTIVFAVILNNRLGVLRRHKEELARLIAAFNEATVRAESGIPKLRKASEEVSRALDEKMERSKMLRDDLAFMVERADSMATRLEEAVRAGRNEAPRPAPGPAAAPPTAGRDIESAAEARERAGEPVAERPIDRIAAAVPRDRRGEAARLGQDRIERARQAMVAETAPPPRPAARRTPPLAAGLAGEDGAGAGHREDDERSEAERELLRALQSAR